MPLLWDDFFAANPLDFTLRTVPAMFAARGDAHAGIDEAVGSIEKLLVLAKEQGEEEGPKTKAKKAPKAKLPVITIAQAKLKPDALAGLDRWKARHPAVAARLAPEDILVDTNRGRATAWYRIRINLKNVPEAERPASEALDPDYDPKTEYGDWSGDG
ncbi:MAG: hypothetical protein H0T65_04355 [Deltaproteobacteria bacterium]|nr:hypothetical protein [Deltaproteobacteria bacterium]